MFFVDTDILSAFAKADAIKYLKEFCKELNISPSIYDELMRAQRAGYSFVDEILQNVEMSFLQKMNSRASENSWKVEKSCMKENAS